MSTEQTYDALSSVNYGVDCVVMSTCGLGAVVTRRVAKLLSRLFLLWAHCVSFVHCGLCIVGCAVPHSLEPAA